MTEHIQHICLSHFLWCLHPKDRATIITKFMDDTLSIFMEKNISLVNCYYIYPIIAEVLTDLSRVYICDTVPLFMSVFGIQLNFLKVNLSLYD